jgi:DNA-binding ferritin-like protein
MWGFMNGNIILDEAAFNKARSEFASLSNDLAKLRADIEAALNALKSGFDTPAGDVFFKSCTQNLLTPLDREKAVIDHISQTLQEVTKDYSPIFSEYQDLVNTINQSQV